MEPNFLGPVMTGIRGMVPNLIERDLIKHPFVGGVVLFSNNIASPQQLKKLTDSLQAIRLQKGLPLLQIALDHEGGVVQRLRGTEITNLPAPRRVGWLFEKDPARARKLQEFIGTITAIELGTLGITMCLGPVLDLMPSHSSNRNRMRYYHDDPMTVAELVVPYVRALQETGMVAVPKHFPGTAEIIKDPHFGIAMSRKSLKSLIERDLVPYQRLHQEGLLKSLMVSHYIYVPIDEQPIAGSTQWLQKIIREQFGWNAVILTDCIQMIGSYPLGRALSTKMARALQSGCDVVMSTQTHCGQYRQFYSAIQSCELADWKSSKQGQESINRFAKLSSEVIDPTLKQSSRYLEAVGQFHEVMHAYPELFMHQSQLKAPSKRKPSVLKHKLKMKIHQHQLVIWPLIYGYYRISIWLHRIRSFLNFVRC